MTNVEQITTTTRFLNSVASVGFSNTEKIKAEVRRLANNPLFQSFLDDFSSSVTSQNLISLKQLNKFKDLGLSESDISLDSTKQKICDLKKKNQKLNKKNERISKQLERSYSYKEKLEAQLHELEQQQARKVNEKENLNSKFERSKQHYKLNLAKHEKAISGYFQKLSEVNIDLDVVSNTVQDTSNETVLMSHTDLGNLLSAEDEYTRQMASYAKKQFTQATAGIQDVNTSFSENISDITTVEETSSELEEKKHLERIMCGYKARKLRLILAKAAESQANGLKSFLDGKVSLVATKTQGFENIHELASAASEAELQSHNILKDILPKLLDKCAKLERSMLLAGDCRLQLAKQKYLTNKQTQMINLLIQQLSRLVLVWMLLKLETSQHENLVCGLHKWSSELEQDLSSVKRRTEHLSMSNVAHRKPSKAKAVIDNRDTAMLSVYAALVSKPPKHSIFKEFSVAHDAAETLTREVDLISNNEKLCFIPATLQTLVNDLNECYDINTSSTNKEFLLTPEQVSDQQTELLSQVSQIRATVSAELTKMEKKKQFIENDQTASAARDIWINFFLQPQNCA